MKEVKYVNKMMFDCMNVVSKEINVVEKNMKQIGGDLA